MFIELLDASASVTGNWVFALYSSNKGFHIGDAATKHWRPRQNAPLGVMLNFDARVKNSDAAQPRVTNVKNPTGCHVDFDACASNFWCVRHKFWRHPAYVKTLIGAAQLWAQRMQHQM